MKRLLLVFIAIAALATVPQAINAQRGLYATYGDTHKNNIKISNTHHRDKHGNIWLGNMSDYRIELRVEWTEVGRGILCTAGIVDPWEISRLKDPKGNLVPNEATILGITYIKGH